jgi:hypothetical protein
MDAPGFARLATARTVALYLLSLLAVAGADLAWRPPDVLRLAALATTLGLAVGLGSLLPDALSAVGAAALRARARLLAFLFLPLPGLLALAVAVVAPPLAPQAASALTLLQVAVLVVSEALALQILALWGALVLTLLAALAGGLPALVGPAGFLALVAVFFSLDHALRRSAAWPGVRPPGVRLVMADALQAVALPVLLLVLALLWLSEPPTAALGDAGTAPLGPEVRTAYQWLVLVALAGGGTVTLLMRWLRGAGSESPPFVELMESRVEAEELVEPATFDEARYAPLRGRVIHTYLRFLACAREAGLRLERHLTPHEIQDRVRRPEDPLSLLTRLFMDARYGPDEPGSEAVRSAEAASRVVCAELRVRRLMARPPRRRVVPSGAP